MTYESKFGDSFIEVRYLMDKDIVDQAKAQGINVGKFRDILAQESFIKFFCENVIVRWSGVRSTSGEELELNLANMFKVFQYRPEVYYGVVMDSARLSNFKF